MASEQIAPFIIFAAAIFLAGFILALGQLAKVAKKRSESKYQLTDSQVFALFQAIK